MMNEPAFDDGELRRATQQCDPLRSTALLLHGMVASDRQWILAQLNPAQREDIEPLLTELDALGFRTNGLEVDRPTASPPEAGFNASLRVDAQLIAALDAVPARRMHAALKNEPASLIRRLAAIHTWSWWPDVVGIVDEETVSTRLTGSAITELGLCALDRAMLDALRQRVDAIGPAIDVGHDRRVSRRSLAAMLLGRCDQIARRITRYRSPKPN